MLPTLSMRVGGVAGVHCTLQGNSFGAGGVGEQARRGRPGDGGASRLPGPARAPTVQADLAAHELIMSTSVRSVAEWRYRAGAREHVVRYSPCLRVNDVEATLAAACNGFGIASALSYQVALLLNPAPCGACWKPTNRQRCLYIRCCRAAGIGRRRLRAFVDFAVAAFAGLDVLS